MSNKVTAVSKYNNSSLVNSNLYHNYTNPSTVRHCHDFIILTSGLQSLCDSMSTIQIMIVDIDLHLVCLLLIIIIRVHTNLKHWMFQSCSSKPHLHTLPFNTTVQSQLNAKILFLLQLFFNIYTHIDINVLLWLTIYILKLRSCHRNTKGSQCTLRREEGVNDKRSVREREAEEFLYIYCVSIESTLCC